MSDDETKPFDLSKDPEFKAWAAHQHAHVMPMIRDAGATVQLVPKTESDIKFAVELGMSIMLDKPIITVIQPGQEISDHLRRVSDAVVVFDPENPEGLSVQAKITEALEKLT